MVIVVRDRETLYVFVKNAKSHITFHRWWQGRGSYPRWNLFYRRMVSNKTLTLKDCYRLAAKHEISYQIVPGDSVTINGVVYNYDSKENTNV